MKPTLLACGDTAFLTRLVLLPVLAGRKFLTAVANASLCFGSCFTRPTLCLSGNGSDGSQSGNGSRRNSYNSFHGNIRSRLWQDWRLVSGVPPLPSPRSRGTPLTTNITAGAVSADGLTRLAPTGRRSTGLETPVSAVWNRWRQASIGVAALLFIGLCINQLGLLHRLKFGDPSIK
jgi:hypothetical protein